MILKGSQRGGAMNLATHLMNDQDNDHVTLYDMRGFVADDLHGALAEAYAISKGTKCTQFLFSLSFNPPKDEIAATEEQFLDAIEKAEEKLGLDNQPRAIVFHEKEGRRHAHVVWSRINAETMTAINLPHFKRKLTSLSRELYLEHGWALPDGLRRDGGKSPLNFTLDEWQQAKRLKLDPREIKQSFIEAWERSDSAKAFKHALEERGYFLARGDRRGFVAIDINGEIFSVPRWIGIKTKDVKSKLGDPEQLPSVQDIKDLIAVRVTDKIRTFIDQVDEKHQQDFEPLNDELSRMVADQRKERDVLKHKQQKRWKEETRQRALKLNTGLRGLWDRVTGARSAVVKQNEKEAYEGLKRDQKQRDQLIIEQMIERRVLQKQIEILRRKHAQNRRILARDVMAAQQIRERREEEITRSHRRTLNRSPYRGPSL